MQRIQDSCLRLTVLTCLTVAGLAANAAATAQCVVPVEGNTCYGTNVLASTTTGDGNSGFGYQALYLNTEGTNNTATGLWAMFSNTTGSYNTASGYAALYENTSGYENTAIGDVALASNTTGYFNTASGSYALVSNTTGYYNTASGSVALYNTTTGFYNTASGAEALVDNITGNRNTADGVFALATSRGSRNVAVGFNAGYAIVEGVDNIMIGAGQKGKAADSGVIRIGSSNFQSKAFMAGIRGVTTGRANAVPVVIDGNGQLGTISSSQRFKEDIRPMGSVSERLLALRPVTFRYREEYEDGSKPIQFGLVAEEVAEAFPELVVYDEHGKPETVRYDLIATVLLNEFQKERSATEAELAQLKAEVAAMAAMIERLEHARMVATTR